MCRTGLRHCAFKSDLERQRYNTKRRLVRNSAKEQKAQKRGDTDKATMYARLLSSDATKLAVLEERINSHEAGSEVGGQKGTHQCSQCGQFAGPGHTCARPDFTPGEPVTRTTARGLSVKVTPGVVDENADLLYKNGQCVAMARAIAEERGWGVAVATYSEEGLVKHAWAVDENGTFWDVQGENGRDLIEEEMDDDEEIAVYRSDELDSLEEDLEGKIGPQDVPLARTFVKNLLDGNTWLSDDWTGHQEARDHEFSTSPSDSDTGRCQDCGQFANEAHSCPKTMTDSVVRDEDGNLLVVHHGSAVAFDSFDAEFTGAGNDTWGSGFYFTTDEATARGYGEHSKSVLLNITNPIRANGKESMNLGDVMFFDAKQSAAILKHHPDIYNQPGDEDNWNPLGDYSPDFWDKDDWSREEIDRMVDSVAAEYFSETSWSSLEGVFPGGKSAAFRSAVRDVTGHDGVVADFGEDGTHWVAWFPEQIQMADAGPTSQAGTSRCDECGQYMSAGHNCPGYQATDLEHAAAGWRSGWSEAEAEAWGDYGSILHADLNKHLRDGEALDADEQALVGHLDTTLAMAPRTEKPYLTYRGISTLRTTRDGGEVGMPAAEWIAANAVPGQTITFDSYASTTLSADMAARFSGSRQEVVKEGVVFEIETTQGGFQGFGPEMEVVLARNTSFEVIEVKEVELDEQPTTLVRLRESAPPATNQRCPECGQYAAAAHSCPAGAPRMVEEKNRYEQVHARYYQNDVEEVLTLPPDDIHEVISDYALNTKDGQFWTQASEPEAGNCNDSAEQFSRALREKGIDAEPVLGLRDARNPEGSYHVVTCIHHDGQHLHVDWTGKQFGVTQMDLDVNDRLEDDPLAPQNIPTPAVWNADRTYGHAISGIADSYDWQDRAPGQPGTFTKDSASAKPLVNADGSEAHALAKAPAEPVDFAFMRNPKSLSSNQAADQYFGQDIEPSGRYMVEQPEGVPTPSGWQSGSVHFEKPLHIEHGSEGYADASSWKQRLSAHYGGKKGKALSQALRNDGYDAIVTSDKYGTSEVVDLTGFSPKAPRSTGGRSGGRNAAAVKVAREPGSWDQSRTYTPKESAAFGKALEERYGDGVEVWVSGGADADSYVTLHKILIPKEHRGKDMGKQIMTDLVAEADRNGWRLALSPGSEWGSSVTRLRKFYGGFGFVNNKGRAKDYRTQESMLRQPQ